MNTARKALTAFELAMVVLLMAAGLTYKPYEPPTPEPEYVTIYAEPMAAVFEREEEIEEETEETEEAITLDEYQKKILAFVTMAEAGNQDELGKRLVIDVVLNRASCEVFPGDTVEEIVFWPGQFTVVSNGSIFKTEPTEDIWELIEEELQERTNNEVVFFQLYRYSSSGEPWAKIGDHYFSTLRKELKTT